MACERHQALVRSGSRLKGLFSFHHKNQLNSRAAWDGGGETTGSPQAVLSERALDCCSDLGKVAVATGEESRRSDLYL